MYGVRGSSRTVYSVLFGAPHALAIIVFLARQFSRIPWARTGHVAYQSQKSVNGAFLSQQFSALVKSRISEKRHPERKAGGAFQEDSTSPSERFIQLLSLSICYH